MHFIFIITLLILVQCSLQKELKSGNQENNNIVKEPYEVGLKIKWMNYTLLCGGSLINPKFVLTSGLCFPQDKGEIKSLDIYIGTKLLHQKDPGTVLPKIKRIIKYNEFDSHLKISDIAVVELQKRVILSNKIAVVKLSTISDTNMLVNKIGTVCVSDALEETNKSAFHLTKVKVRIGTLPRAKNINVTDPSRIKVVSEVKSGHRFFGLLGSALTLGNTNTQVGINTISNSQIYQGNTGNIFTNIGPYSNWVNKVIN